MSKQMHEHDGKPVLSFLGSILYVVRQIQITAAQSIQLLRILIWYLSAVTTLLNSKQLPLQLEK
jgi:hypothetical protein